ncbi:MAG TPA: ABC transporter substrate-binding protein [Gaiellaceae bacterium]|nr:ABC transporter substrate-binding protein [Gaiellaceae bacterium]
MPRRRDERRKHEVGHGAQFRAVLGVCIGVAVVAASLIAAAVGPTSASGASTAVKPAPTLAQACGTKPVTLNAYVETGFPDPIDLMNLFHKQHPTVSWKIRQDAFAVITQNAPLVLNGPNPPDIMRLPQVSGLVKDHLLKNLDGYFKQYHWSAFPASQLSQVRMPPAGRPRGTGSLWAYGLNYSLTGVFYNKTLATKAGIASPPTTLAQFDADLAKAKNAGLTPIVQFDGGATGGLLFPLQQLMAIYGQPTPINNWIFQKPGANINTPSNLAATQHLQQWIKAGYFNSDANATDYPTMMSKFEHDEGVFMFDGDWESGNLQKLLPGKAGFFLMPTLKAGQKHTGMSAPLTYGIAAKAKHANCAAFFFNWVTTNPAARKLNVSVGGSNPGGPPSLAIPVPKGAALIGQTLAAGKTVAKDNGAMDFIANATGAIYAQSWTPEVQKLFAGQESPDGVLKSVQADYLKQVANGG